MKATRVRVLGNGITALAVSHLVARRGLEVHMDPPAADSDRIVALPLETVELLAHLFELDPLVLVRGTPVHEHAVDWDGGPVRALARSSVVCRLGHVVARLARAAPRPARTLLPDDGPWDWTVDATGRAPTGRAAGAREAVAGRWSGAAPEPRIRIRATRNGWLFDAPTPTGDRALLIVAPTPARLPRTAEAVAAWLVDAGWSGRQVSVSRVVPVGSVAPQFADVVARPGWLAAGDAALALDPLRGDGAGFGLRSALLAQAVIGAVARGEPAAACIAHHARRLTAVFVGHLRGCCAHYASARAAGIWREEIRAMSACADALAPGRDFEWRLEGAELCSIPSG